MVRPRALGLFALLLTGSLALWSTVARADHSLGRACLSCHSLRSTNVLAGSRNIACSNINDALYGYSATCGNNANTFWYCPSINSASQWSPAAPDNEPLDCSYCHDTGGDIGDEIGRGTITTASPASAHPVDVRGTALNVGSIRCNDCHGADVLPTGPCDKTGTGDGYPNHLNVQGSTPAGLATGTNARIGVAAHLAGEYGPTAGDTWGSSGGSPDISTVVCFDCHRSAGAASTNILAEYDAPHGGHNLLNPANGTDARYGDLDDIKLPCYDCHDPHASNQNEKLIIDNEDTPRNPYNTSYSGYAPPTGFGADPTTNPDDYKVCVTCHDNGRIVEGVAIGDVVGVNTITSVFPFHADAHDDVTATSNCLQPYGGCHQSPHNTDVFRCLDCHSQAVVDAIDTMDGSATGGLIQAPDRLRAVAHTDSEFGHIGAIGHNKIQSVHTIPYAATVWTTGDPPSSFPFPAADAALDMSDPINNGCMYCHDTVNATNRTLPTLKDADDAFYNGSRGTDFTGVRENLSHFDAFCLSCHDGAGPTFTVPAYTLSNDSLGGSNVNFLAGTLYPPQVNNKPGVGDGYYYTAGHGRGLLGSPSGAYLPTSGVPVPNTNPGAEVPCLECHVYHGSTAYKLLPGWRESDDGIGHVLKGGAYPPKLSTGVESTSTLNPIGDAINSAVIDYTDYTGPTKYARAESDYRDNDYFSSYVNGFDPTGEPTPFGSSGDLFGGALGCNEDTNNLSTPTGSNRTNGTKEIGFCNTCHLFTDGATAPTDGTTTTYSLAYSHRGDPTLLDCSSPTPQPLGSKRTFWRDCLECHDPHGSGTDSATGTANLYMVRAWMKRDPTNYTNVAFTSRGKEQSSDSASLVPGSFDPDDTGNGDDLCNVCHTGLDWSNLSSGAGNDHVNGFRCTKCHPHGM